MQEKTSFTGTVNWCLMVEPALLRVFIYDVFVWKLEVEEEIYLTIHYN